MAWSKSTRISIMLAIDVVFFLVELIVGLVVKSLALTADAFHMLNDIISLCVGLWAVAVARKATTDKYSYGWLRAEILGAFFNAVFLIALCVSIILEAITRFFDPPEIENPQLILIVGSLGLASNLVGFFVLGGHGHSHGDHSHDDGDHDHSHAHSAEHAAEEGRSDLLHSAAHDDGGNVGDVLPEAIVARATAGASPETPRRIRFERESSSSGRCQSHASTSKDKDRRRTSSRHHSRLTSIEDISIYPSSFRQEIIAASQPQIDGQESTSESEVEETVVDDGEPDEESPLLKSNNHNKSYLIEHPRGRSASKRPRRESSLHNGHNHNKERKKAKGSHGHDHGDMGMNAMVLHVIGDALGNVGVIVTALIIWLTDWPGRFYADPAVSLFITLIILKSALPLTKATSKVLLQATPDNIDLNEVREDIQNLPGVISCHHVHIWQLSDTKIVASLHVHVNFPISAEGGEKYMELAKRARKCLHAYGIHAATIQPEFCDDDEHHHPDEPIAQYDGAGSISGSPKQACLLECVDDCVGKGCCTDSTAAGSVRSQSAHSHDDHGHDHDHDHGHGHSHAH
ncbi:Zinc/cadmium resistance protein 2 [Colletotrichum chlorophyti]|uniref:Zinc/cadmium resistance protein 2 n=1 Tax=Colletotrichum chlorophyti TaxID=708187 RepID=A0A1Q8RBQ9_9PEZI|nr:Zinc/cadmium resistance protein 2 [Colletotrichum chlorophyti]